MTPDAGSVMPSAAAFAAVTVMTWPPVTRLRSTYSYAP
jgi:hypothetical protein